MGRPASAGAIMRKLEELEAQVAALTELVAAQREDVLAAEEAARMLGYRNVRSLYNKINGSEGPAIPHFRDGKRLRFRRSDLVAYMTRQRVASQNEIDQMASAMAARR